MNTHMKKSMLSGPLALHSNFRFYLISPKFKPHFMKKFTAILWLLPILLAHFNAKSQTLPTYVPQTGLLGWWPFNGNANDESGNNNNCTINGASPTTDRFNDLDRAYNFDGVNDYLIASTHNLPLSNNTVSISAWFLPNQYPGSTSRAICSWGQWSNNNARYLGLRGATSQPK
jgi:hypothetical protein